MRRATVAAIVPFVAGCQQLLGLHDLPADAPRGNPLDGAVVYMDAPHAFDDAQVSAALCFGQQGQTGYYVCLGALPTQQLALSGTLDTDTCTSGTVATLTGPNQRVCVVAGAGVTVNSGARLSATGTLALVIASTTDISIAGTLDVSSPQNMAVGAGGDPAGCNNVGTDGTSSVGGAGGGAGGAFGTRGGDGGPGGGGVNGGLSTMAFGTNRLHGGCHGGFGGDGFYALGGGAYGFGGGAVWLVARNTVTIGTSGIVNASGGFGAGGAQGKPGNGGGGGGGGGGSGGMILIDAVSLVISGAGVLVANGGGGGGGGDSGGAGQSGQLATPTTPSVPALGGNGSGNGGNGGSGAAGTSGAASGTNAPFPQGGGGGGGGGAGLIEVIGVTAPSGGDVSPPAQRI